MINWLSQIASVSFFNICTVPQRKGAAIAAAVTVALREPVRIHHIHIHQDETQAAWSRIGRLDIMRSHSTGSAKF